MVSLEFFINLIVPAAVCPGVDSASNRNEYRGIIFGAGGGGVKDGRCVGLTILHLLANCLEILGASTPGALGPVQACDGIVLQSEKLFSTIFSLY